MTYSTLYLTPEASYADGAWRAKKPLPESYGAEGFGSVLNRAAAHMAPDAEMVMDGAMAKRLGLGAMPPHTLGEAERKAHPALVSAREAGWKISSLSPWMTFWGEGRHPLHVGVLDWMESTDLPGQGPTPVDTATLLHAWKDAVGAPWAGTASVAGANLVRAVARGPFRKSKTGGKGYYERPRWQLPEDQHILAWGSAASFHGLNWKAPAPHRYRFEHTFDVNKQWLTAAAQCPLAHQFLRHTGKIPFDAKRAGFWLVRFERWPRLEILPDPAGARAAAASPGAAVWVSTPRLALVHQLAQREDEFLHPGYEIVDSWTEEGSLVLQPWAEKLKIVLNDPDLGQPARDVYAKTMTTISRPGRRVFRPDWAASVVDLAHCNLWRKLLAVGAAGGGWPVRCGADQPTYGSDCADWQDDIPAGLEIDPHKFGKLKWRETKEITK